MGVARRGSAESILRFNFKFKYKQPWVNKATSNWHGLGGDKGV